MPQMAHLWATKGTMRLSQGTASPFQSCADPFMHYGGPSHHLACAFEYICLESQSLLEGDSSFQGVDVGFQIVWHLRKCCPLCSPSEKVGHFVVEQNKVVIFTQLVCFFKVLRTGIFSVSFLGVTSESSPSMPIHSFFETSALPKGYRNESCPRVRSHPKGKSLQFPIELRVQFQHNPHDRREIIFVVRFKIYYLIFILNLKLFDKFNLNLF